MNVGMKMKVSEIIELVGGKLLQGDLEKEFSGMGALNEVGAEGISFFGNEKYLNEYLASNAGLILVGPKAEKKDGDVVLVEAENPSYAFGQLMSHASGKKRVFKAGVHPTAVIAESVKYNPEKVCVKAGAVIEDDVVIGDGTEIGINVVIAPDTKIGKDCLIYANVTIQRDCLIGDRVVLHPGCVIGADGYGYELVGGEHKKVDQLGIVVLGDDVEIGANATIDRARFGETVVGKGTKIDNMVMIGHNVEIGEHCLLISQCGVSGSSKLGNYVTIAGQTGITGHVEIGDKAIVMARSGVAKSLPGGQVYLGFPARPVKEELKKQAALAKLPSTLKKLKKSGKG